MVNSYFLKTVTLM